MWLSCRILLLTAFSICTSPVQSAGAAQYCRDEPGFCVSVTTRTNTTTHGRDVLVNLLAQPSENGGWTSVGIGQGMAGALMFLVYSDRSRQTVTASIRTASGHVMPTVLTTNKTEVNVLHTEATESNRYYAQFVCYSCDQWWPEKIDVSSAAQPWIYATNAKQIFYTAEADTNLMIHDAFGSLTVDMSSTLLTDEQDSVPSIQAGQSFGVILVKEHSDKDNEEQKPWLSAVQLHGIIMTVSFMGLFMAGGAIIRLPLTRSFKYHWVVQLAASILTVGNALYMLLRSRHLGPHKIIGLIVISALIVQGALGYKHHAVFVKIRRQSFYTTLHLWLGRAVLCLGTFNVGTGLYYRGWSTGALIMWLAIWAAEIVGYSYLVLLHQRRKQRQEKGQPIAMRPLKDEDDDDVFDVGEDEDETDDADAVEGVPLMERAGHEHAKDLEQGRDVK